MTINNILKEIKGVFKLPKKVYYLGKIAHGAPYMYPSRFNSSIISVRKLKLRDEQSKEIYIKDRPWLAKQDNYKFINLPMVRRNKEKIIKLFGNYYFFQFGFPLAIKFVELGWKDKWESPRFEWVPQFHIFVFKWQFCIHWVYPSKQNDLYWEQILWWKYYCNKDIVKAKKTWMWQDFNTKQSTWNDEFLI